MGPISDPECINALNSKPIVLIPRLQDFLPPPVNPCKSEPIDNNDVGEIFDEDNTESTAEMIEVVDIKMIDKKIEEIHYEPSGQDENSSPNTKSETTEDLTSIYPKTVLNRSTSAYNNNQNEENRKCPICDRILSSARNLRRHIDVHKPIKPHFCDECGASFRRSDYLQRHLRVHEKKETFTCIHCYTTFTRKYNMYKHIKRIHFGELPFACTICKKSFPKREDLRLHRQTHDIEKPFECNNCHRSFSDKSTLRMHASIHTGERPFVCNTCGATFRMKKILARHEFKHTGEKPYMCTDCQSAFTRAYTLKNHLKKIYHCSICGGTFNCRNSLQLHLYGHSHTPHSGEWENFRKVDNYRWLNQLMNSEEGFVCGICDLVFSKKLSLIDHIKNHSDLEFLICKKLEVVDVKDVL